MGMIYKPVFLSLHVSIKTLHSATARGPPRIAYNIIEEIAHVQLISVLRSYDHFTCNFLMMMMMMMMIMMMIVASAI